MSKAQVAVDGNAPVAVAVAVAAGSRNDAGRTGGGSNGHEQAAHRGGGSKESGGGPAELPAAGAARSNESAARPDDAKEQRSHTLREAEQQQQQRGPSGKEEQPAKMKQVRTPPDAGAAATGATAGAVQPPKHKVADASKKKVSAGDDPMELSSMDFDIDAAKRSRSLTRTTDEPPVRRVKPIFLFAPNLAKRLFAKEHAARGKASKSKSRGPHKVRTSPAKRPAGRGGGKGLDGATDAAKGNTRNAPPAAQRNKARAAGGKLRGGKKLLILLAIVIGLLLLVALVLVLCLHFLAKEHK